MSKRPRTAARCTACGHVEPRWVGRCSGCDEWGTIEEVAVPKGAVAAARGGVGARTGSSARPVTDVPGNEHDRIPTGVSELDRTLGGGFVPGSVTLLGGEPGIGKSTILLQACAALAGDGRRLLYASAEESAGQVRLRADRLGIDTPGLLLTADTSVEAIIATARDERPELLVIDSIQTVARDDLDNAAGSVVQVRESAGALTRLAKDDGIATVLVGHVTKDGTIAGPRTLEHLVDVVLSFEGDRHHALRLVRTLKNRFGPAGEVGCFEMAGDGLVEVTDPARLFRSDHPGPTSGVALAVTVEGPRPLVVEVQALVNTSHLPSPRRQATGVDRGRLSLLLAVLEQRAGVPLGSNDVYASAVGGMTLREPACDLSLALALASSHHDRPVKPGLVAIGEIGLAGEVRNVPRIGPRLLEAARLGFRHAIVPASYDGPAHGVDLVAVTDVHRVLLAGLTGLAAADVA